MSKPTLHDDERFIFGSWRPRSDGWRSAVSQTNFIRTLLAISHLSSCWFTAAEDLVPLLRFQGCFARLTVMSGDTLKVKVFIAFWTVFFSTDCTVCHQIMRQKVVTRKPAKILSALRDGPLALIWLRLVVVFAESYRYRHKSYRRRQGWKLRRGA